MLFSIHLRRGQVSKSYAILPIGGAITGHTIYRQSYFAMRRFCNETWAYMNKTNLWCAGGTRRSKVATPPSGTHQLWHRCVARCCRGPIRRHRSHQIFSPREQIQIALQASRPWRAIIKSADSASADRCMRWRGESYCAKLRFSTLPCALLFRVTYNVSSPRLRIVGRR
jgi:hypothetical protein